MDILIHSDGLTLTARLKAAIEDKIGRLDQYAPRAMRARVRIRKNSAHVSERQYRVHVLFELPGKDVSVEDSGPEALSALDVVAEKLERRLRRVKTTRLARRAKGGLSREKNAK